MLLVELFEDASKKKHQLDKLAYKLSDLEPVLSKQNIDWHYNVHSKGYEKSANETGEAFPAAGVYLHNIWWAGLCAPKSGNKPKDDCSNFIDEKFNDFKTFQAEFEEAALATKGSQWIALNKSGKIITIDKHKIVKNLVVLLDMWEHSFYPTYGPDKKKYLKAFWRIVNWDESAKRLLT